MRVLLTGFEPYGEFPQNSSWAVAGEVAARGFSGVMVEQLPVSFGRVGACLREMVERHNPDVVIMLGQSGGSSVVKIERVALNMMDARIVDNDGCAPCEEFIAPNAPAAYFTQLPIKALCRAVEEKGVAVKISNSCGLYVCNRLYYEALALCGERPQMKALFVHLPFFEGQSSVMPGKFTMPLSEMVTAIQTLIEELYDKN